MAWKMTSSMLSVSSTLLLAATLTGCSVSAPYGVARLSEVQRASDELPVSVAEEGTLDSATSRLLVSADGIQYFVAEGASGDDVCLVVYESTDSWVSGCSTGLPIGVTLMDHPEVQLTTYVNESDEWAPLGENLVIRKE